MYIRNVLGSAIIVFCDVFGDPQAHEDLSIEVLCGDIGGLVLVENSGILPRDRLSTTSKGSSLDKAGIEFINYHLDLRDQNEMKTILI